MAAKHLINKEITVPRLTVIDADGRRHTDVQRFDAYNMAHQYEMDLVLVSADPPVAKILDYGRFLFEEKKRAKERANDPELKKKQNFTDMKEITLSYKIAEHDERVLIDRAASFLAKGHRVRFSIRLRGREIVHKDLAVTLLQRMFGAVEPQPKQERAPMYDGNRVIMVLMPA